MLFSYDGHPIHLNKDVEVEQCLVLKNGNSTKTDKKIM